MKKGLKLAALAAAAVLLLSFAGCAVDVPDSSSTSSETTSESTSETESAAPEVDESKYEDTLDGLAKYMIAKEYIAGDATEMEADFIGAEKGVKYTGSFEGTNNISMELYEYDTANLNDTAKEIIDSVKKDGKFELMGMTADAVVSDNGKYLMVYKDSASGETHDARTEQVKADFQAFKK